MQSLCMGEGLGANLVYKFDEYFLRLKRPEKLGRSVGVGGREVFATGVIDTLL